MEEDLERRREAKGSGPRSTVRKPSIKWPKYSIELTLYPNAELEEHFDTPSFLQRRRRLYTLLTRDICAATCSLKEDGITLVACFDRAADVAAAMQWVREKSDPDLCVAYCNPSDPISLARSRYLPFEPEGSYVDFRTHLKMLNEDWTVLCQECGWRDEERVPQPYIVQASALKARQDVFLVQHGMVVVRAWVKDLLSDLISDEIWIGSVATYDRATERIRGTTELFIIRPLLRAGQDPFESYEPICATCGRGKRGYSDPHLSGPLLTHFGRRRANLAVIDSWWGGLIEPGLNRGIFRQSLISGGLYAYLFNKGVRGLAWPEEGCYLSLKGEEPLEAERRFDVFPPEEDTFLKRK